MNTMASSNGISQEAENTRILIGLVARLNDALLGFSVEQRLSSDRLARLEAAVEKVRDVALEIKHHLVEARDDIDRWTPQSVPLLDPAAYPLGGKKDSSGPAFAISDKPKLHLPASWASWLLKLGLSAGFGGAVLRFVQWMTTGH